MGQTDHQNIICVFFENSWSLYFLHVSQQPTLLNLNGITSFPCKLIANLDPEYCCQFSILHCVRCSVFFPFLIYLLHLLLFHLLMSQFHHQQILPVGNCSRVKYSYNSFSLLLLESEQTGRTFSRAGNIKSYFVVYTFDGFCVWEKEFLQKSERSNYLFPRISFFFSSPYDSVFLQIVHRFKFSELRKVQNFKEFEESCSSSDSQNH